MMQSFTLFSSLRQVLLLGVNMPGKGACLGVLIFLGLNVSAQNTAFINEALLLKATPGYEQAVQEMESTRVDFQKEIIQSQSLLSAKMNNLLKHYSFEKDATEARIESQLSEHDLKRWLLLKEEGVLLEKQIQAKEEEYQYLFKEKVGSIIDQVNLVLVSYCQRNKIGILHKLDQIQSSVAYFDPKLDITTLVIADIQLHLNGVQKRSK
jgi:Skp family chaperone for outer membrane proteins